MKISFVIVIFTLLFIVVDTTTAGIVIIQATQVLQDNQHSVTQALQVDQ